MQDLQRIKKILSSDLSDEVKATQLAAIIGGKNEEVKSKKPAKKFIEVKHDLLNDAKIEKELSIKNVINKLNHLTIDSINKLNDSNFKTTTQVISAVNKGEKITLAKTKNVIRTIKRKEVKK